MDRYIKFLPIIFLSFAVFALNGAWGAEGNLWVNRAVTVKIRTFDRGFFKGFEVYSAGTLENPSALLFDIKDDYHLADRLWEDPIAEDAVVFAIHRLDDQYMNRTYDIPFLPRALNIVNTKGEILGYVYTGMTYVHMERKKDGRVLVHLPNPTPFWGGIGDTTERSGD